MSTAYLPMYLKRKNEWIEMRVSYLKVQVIATLLRFRAGHKRNLQFSLLSTERQKGERKWVKERASKASRACLHNCDWFNI